MPKRVLRSILHIIKLYIAWGLIKLGFKGRTKNGQIWVFGGCSRRYFADNSAVLFEYVRQEFPDLDAYWVINRNSPDVNAARKLGNVLFADSVKAYITILTAEVHIISHGAGDIPGCDSRFNTAFRVRLGHGLTALKKTKGSLLRQVASRNRQFDLVPVASQAEKFNKLEWGIDESKLAITGLARFDRLKIHEKKQRPGTSVKGSTILYLPTWRSWLDSVDSETRNREFYVHVFGIFRDQRLLDFMEANDIRFRLCPHMGMREDFMTRSHELNVDRLSLIQSYYDLSYEISRCDLLITDYSSIAWDSLYAGTPVIFYQFDHDSFVKERGTHVDFISDLFGPLCVNSQELVAQITEHWGKAQFEEQWRPRMKSSAEKMFAFQDDDNCQRIIAEILRRLPTSNKLAIDQAEKPLNQHVGIRDLN